MTSFGAFHRLCVVANKHDLIVQTFKNKAGHTSVWIFADTIGDSGIYIGVVSTPFWHLSSDAAAEQLLHRLSHAGYR